VSAATHAITLESKEFSCKDLRIRSLVGREATSKMFEFEPEVVALDGIGPDRDALVTSSITLVFAPLGLGGVPHRVHGNITPWDEDLEAPPGLARLSLRVVPGRWRSRRSRPPRRSSTRAFSTSCRASSTSSAASRRASLVCSSATPRATSWRTTRGAT